MNQNTYYSELFNDLGKVKPQYLKLDQKFSISSMKKIDERRLLKESQSFFADDYAQDCIPRVIDAADFSRIQLGVGQRARAILAFLTDYCARGRKWKKVMPGQILQQTISRNHSTDWIRKLKPEQIAFPYGPDIIRDRFGSWRIIEDSAGVIGGLGDLVYSRRVFFRQLPAFRQTLFDSTHNPEIFIESLASYFQERAQRKRGVALLYLRSYVDEPDHETKRLAKCFSRFGIETLTTGDRKRKLEIKEGAGGGVFLKEGSDKTRVGALIFRSRPEEFCSNKISISLKDLLDAKNEHKLINRILQTYSKDMNRPTLRRPLLEDQVWTNFALGTQFVNDKIFGVYVDSMIRTFLKQEPILKSLETQLIGTPNKNGNFRVNRSLLNALRRDRGRYVVKQADDDGGKGVWIGCKQTKRSLEPLIRKLLAEPHRFIIQEFEHLSVLSGRIVDLRLHSHVDHERVIISNTPWGRANWLNGDGKVNLSSNGFMSPVFVQTE